MGPIFKGRWLPGRTVLKAIERGSQGVSSFLNRAFIMPKGKEEERKKWTQQMKHKAGQRDAVRVRQGQWNLAAGLPVGALGPVWPPCELGGGGMVLVTMEDLEAKEETADDEVEGEETVLGGEIAGALDGTTDVDDEEEAVPRKRPRLDKAIHDL
ncbi:hypothetical protein PMZ80_002836 [Knufia obscura]|uniref:Uncharacterized protein n=2 Tax=Knufia TaxID=430999 RepID=A0AAN8I3I5_9EURO|nr:hypothetical protein PMZ80_002836 [Knufia obscura]KAK5948426.1 hypothetical protein OHC33_010600 [Knufia fluminis]